MNLFNFSLPELLIRVPVVLFSLMIHEVAHGYIAYRLGDPTARSLGRLTLNPLKHLDPIGALCMVLFHYGWAKPVPINTRYFRDPKRDMALTALAGPMSNLILAFAGVVVYYITAITVSFLPAPTGFALNVFEAWSMFLSVLISLNVTYCVFNMIPVPPFDGSRIFLSFLPPRYYFGIMRYERYILIGFMLLLWTKVLNGPISWMVQSVMNIMFNAVGWVVSLFM